MSRQTARRGRPAATWLTPDALAGLPLGTAIALQLTGRHDRRTIGRLTAVSDSHLLLAGPADDPLVDRRTIKRGRVIDALYEPGDPVLRRGIPADVWRGGVVEPNGADGGVLVEQIDGSFAWFTEAELEPAEARDPVAPPLPRGPVPARTG